MSKRKPVLVLYIITAVFYIATIALLLVVCFGSSDMAIGFGDLNKAIIDNFTNFTASSADALAPGITMIIAAAVPFIFALIAFIVHLKRKQNSVTVILLLSSLVAIYIDLLMSAYSLIFYDDIMAAAKAGTLLSNYLFVALSIFFLAAGQLFFLVTFIVDMAIRVKPVPTYQPNEVAPVQQARVEEVPPQPLAAEAAPVNEVKQPVKEEIKQEPVITPAPKVKQEPVVTPVEEKEEPIKEEKKSVSKKPAKKVEKKPEAKPAKKVEPKKAEKKPTKKTEPKKEEAKKTVVTDEGNTIVKAYHVSQRKELKKWQVKGAGSDKAIKLFDTQKEAIEYANELAAKQGATVRVHSRSGKMRKA